MINKSYKICNVDITNNNSNTQQAHWWPIIVTSCSRCNTQWMCEWPSKATTGPVCNQHIDNQVKL